MEIVSRQAGLPGVMYLILDMTPVPHADAMGLHFLEEVVFETQKKGIQLILANPSIKVRGQWRVVCAVNVGG